MEKRAVWGSCNFILVLCKCFLCAVFDNVKLVFLWFVRCRTDYLRCTQFCKKRLGNFDKKKKKILTEACICMHIDCWKLEVNKFYLNHLVFVSEWNKLLGLKTTTCNLLTHTTQRFKLETNW